MRAVIVDGGRATRLAGHSPPKGLVPVGLNGETLLELLVSQLWALGAKRPTLVLGYESGTRLLRSSLSEQVDLVLDYEMKGALNALRLVADRFRDEDVIVTTGDCWFSSLAQLRMAPLQEEDAVGTVRVLTAPQQLGRPQILSAGHRKPIPYIGRLIKPGTVSYAGAMRIVRCPAYWRAVQMGIEAEMKWIVRPLLFLPAGAIKLLPVTGRWGHVNTPEDLNQVREMCRMERG